MTLFALLFGSTWSQPAQLVAVWDGPERLEVTLPRYDRASCDVSFELTDGHTVVAWSETLPDTGTTVGVDVLPPDHGFAETDTLLLKLRATCWSDAGTIVERTRLPALVVQPAGDRLADAMALSVEEDGTLMLDSPLGVWTSSTDRPVDDPDDDPLRNEEVSR